MSVALVMRGLSMAQARRIAEECYGKLDWQDFDNRALIADPHDDSEEHRCEIVYEG